MSDLRAMLASITLRTLTRVHSGKATADTQARYRLARYVQELGKRVLELHQAGEIDPLDAERLGFRDELGRAISALGALEGSRRPQGALRALLLRELLKSPQLGTVSLAKRTHEGPRSFSSVRTTLRRLARQGYVTQWTVEGTHENAWSITAAGRDWLVGYDGG